jgi:hypothetical protein
MALLGWLTGHSTIESSVASLRASLELQMRGFRA